MIKGIMILTLREQIVIKEWNKKGLGGLRISSLALLENIGGRVDEDDGKDVCEMLIRHTIKMLPQGIWDKSEGYCEEICFLADVEFDEITYMSVLDTEREEREDIEFD